jgi:methionyl-tRNA formyltransferase
VSPQNSPKNWRILFAGSPAYAIPTLEAILSLPNIEVVGVLTQKAKPTGRGQAEKPSAIGEYAQKKNLLVLTPDSLKDAEISTLISSLKADCGVVIAYGKIIPESLLNSLPFGWLNLHASILPRWRGASPIQYAIMSGDLNTGATLMKIEKGLDTGAILVSAQISIKPDEIGLSLAKKLSNLSASMINQHLTTYLLGKSLLTNQPEIGVTLAPKIEKADGQISWHEPAEVIERKIRALNPWPGTYTNWQNKKIIIKEAVITEGKIEPALIAKHALGCSIGTSTGLLIPKIIQVSGKKPTTIDEFLRGYQNFIGSKLS